MKSPKTRAPKSMKARRMWANYYEQLPILYSDKESARFCSSGVGIQHAVVPVAVIPLDDVNALLAAANSAYGTEPTMSCMNGMVAAFTAIGVLPKKRKGRK